MLFGAGCSSNSMEYCLETGECELAIDVVKVSGGIPIDPNDPFWADSDHLQVKSIELGPQMVTNPRWPDPSTKSVKLSAVQNKSEIALLLEWDDETLENRIEVSATHTDQAAIMFPLYPDKEVPLITMGSENEIVNIWQWRAIWEKSLNAKPRRIDRNLKMSAFGNDRRSPVEDLTAAGYSTLTTQEEQDVLGRGTWQDKTWRVVFKRSLVNSDNADIQFKYPIAMAIAVWNGGNRERNGQKGISNWILLRL
jgi:DMSO reductase family type II enzyme heme b subunit